METPASPAQPLIGILAGMGPDSTAPFLDMVLEECREQYGASQDEDFPPISILSWPTPFRPDRPIDHAALREAIGRGLDLLATQEPALVAMPCNTAHLYWDWLQARIEAVLLDMVGAAVAELPPEIERVLLLATRATREAEIYEGPLRQRGKTTVVSEELQREIDQTLVATKRDPAAGMKAWARLLERLEEVEADAALVACSDLTPLAEQLAPARLSMVDSTRLLARHLVGHWLTLASDRVSP